LKVHFNPKRATI